MSLKKDYILKILKKAVYVIFFLVNSNQVNAQNIKLSGIVVDSIGNPLYRASVLLKDKSNKIVTYKFTNTNGAFLFTLSDSIQRELYFEVKFTGYTTLIEVVEPSKLYYSFRLKANYINLDDVTVKNKIKIKSSGDTLSYDVESFSSKNDKSIGDVIKRLPGMVVLPDGTIEYNCVKVKSVLIHSDDLMGGKYGLATRSITKEMIRKIEVIEHHQPLNVLKNKVETNDVVINLVLKNENSTQISGIASIGLGIPKLINSSINAILLNKKIKFLNTLKYDNTGSNISNDFKDLSELENIHPTNLLFDESIDNPGLPNQYIYNNKTLGASINNLFNTKDSLQFKINIEYFNDNNQLSYNYFRQYNLLDSIITYTENQLANRQPNFTNLSLQVTKNTKNAFLKNHFKTNLATNETNTFLNFNGNNFNQNLLTKVSNLNNNFLWIPSILKNDIVKIEIDVDYRNAPQNLLVATGIDSLIFNNGNPYKALNQNAKITSFYHKIGLSYIVNNQKKIQQFYLLAIENKYQHLTSQIELTQLNNSNSNFSGDFGNNLKWQSNKTFFAANYSIKKTNWRVALNIPFIAERIKYEQTAYTLNSTKKYYYSNPEINSELYLSPENTIQIKYANITNIGEIENIYKGLVVANFKNFSRNNPFITESNTNLFQVRFNSKRTTKMIFLNAFFRYQIKRLNALETFEINDNIINSIFLPISNTQKIMINSIGVSKYIFALKTKINATTRFTNSELSQYINNTIRPFERNNLTIEFETESRIADFFTLNYAGSISYTKNRQKTLIAHQNIINTLNVYQHQLSIILSPLKLPLNITISNNYQQNKSNAFLTTSYLFTNLSVLYKDKKTKMDYSVSVQNLFDVKEFNSFLVQANAITSSNFILRGRMIMFNCVFNF